jgi:hypothetical protein
MREIKWTKQDVELAMVEMQFPVLLFSLLSLGAACIVSRLGNARARQWKGP